VVHVPTFNRMMIQEPLHIYADSLTDSISRFLAVRPRYKQIRATKNNLVRQYLSHPDNSRQVGWCLMALSAQKGYIVPCKN